MMDDAPTAPIRTARSEWLAGLQAALLLLVSLFSAFAWDEIVSAFTGVVLGAVLLAVSAVAAAGVAFVLRKLRVRF
ncbi:hypothetical protein V5F40_21660 [Xanthobacter sp. DSM 14520]|uniref:hypothetical protein n=1 Tax=Xanthobacter autotrophicus (strain ATCC BAA-1158 / Py2) TaxID=78245 RepID=UPI00372A0D8F